MHQDLSITALPFMVGLMWGFIVFTTTMFWTLREYEPQETAGDLFEAEIMGDDDDDFRVFVVRRLSESPAFRRKVIDALCRLHEKYPKTYAQVMRPGYSGLMHKHN